MGTEVNRCVDPNAEGEPKMREGITRDFSHREIKIHIRFATPDEWQLKLRAKELKRYATAFNAGRV